MDSTMNKKEDSAKWSASQAIIATLLAITFSLVYASLAGYVALKIGLSEDFQTFVLYAANTLGLLLIAVIFIKLRKVKLKEFFKLPKNSKTLFLLPLHFAIYFFFSFLVQQLLTLVPGFNADQAQPVGYDNVGGSGLVMVFVSLVIFPPLGEEVIFRGILYQGLKTKLGKVLAAVIVSILFGLAHMQWNVGVDTFVLSLVAIYYYEKYQSIWFPIGLHAIKNFVAFLVLFVFHL